ASPCEPHRQPGMRPKALAALVLEIEACVERSLGDLELLGARLGGREPVLQLVTRKRECTREAAIRGALHPAEDLGRCGDRTEGARGGPRGPHVPGRLAGEEVREGGGRGQGADEMPAAALVLLRSRRVVLVGADRDVLGAVVGGELAAA